VTTSHTQTTPGNGVHRDRTARTRSLVPILSRSLDASEYGACCDQFAGMGTAIDVVVVELSGTVEVTTTEVEVDGTVEVVEEVVVESGVVVVVDGGNVVDVVVVTVEV